MSDQNSDPRTAVVRDGTAADLDGVARVWAAATAARDGHRSAAPLERARARIDEVIEGRGYVLSVAVDSRPIAFALALPRGPEAELVFVGVDPSRWREGHGAAVLSHIARQLRAAGCTRAELDVYADNAGALALYEGLGWARVPRADTLHPRTGKPQVRYRLTLGGAPGIS